MCIYTMAARKIVTPPHAPTAAKRLLGLHLWYSGKNYSDAFQCPVCQRTKRYNLNFLGSRVPVCSGGAKFTLEAKAPGSPDTRKQRILDALHEVDHYREFAQEAVSAGQLEEAEGWLSALTEEVTKALESSAVSED